MAQTLKRLNANRAAQQVAYIYVRYNARLLA
jgi:hypothetical protein